MQRQVQRLIGTLERTIEQLNTALVEAREVQRLAMGGPVIPTQTLEAMPGARLVSSIDEAAKQLNIGVNTLRELLVSGRVRSYKNGNRWLVSHQALLDFIAQQETLVAEGR